MYQRTARNRGTAIVLAIILSVVITGLVCAMAWVAGQSASTTGSLSKMDQAFFAAEAGAQQVAWNVKYNNLSSLTSPLTGTCNGYSYTTTWTGSLPVVITSTGSSGVVSYTMTMNLIPPTPPAAAVAEAGDFDGKNINVTGNVITGGAYTSGGAGGVNGNVNYHSSANNTGSVSGTLTQSAGAFQSIFVDTIGATLMAAASSTYNGAQNGTVFNFTLLPGTNKVIVVHGAVTNPTFIGAGTLYVTGPVSTVSGFGTVATPVNIVATGDITLNNNQTFYGSLYSQGSVTTGKFDMTGMIYAEGVARVNSGNSSLTMGAIPWFDPRNVNGGAGSPMKVSGMAGPQP